MSYFDPTREIKLHVDVSPFGFGAILTQTVPGQTYLRVIAYASRSLTTTEIKYSQTEHDAPAIFFLH